MPEPTAPSPTVAISPPTPEWAASSWNIHPWQVTPAEAQAIQRELAARIELTDPPDFAPQRLAGVDVGFEQDGAITRAAVVVLDYATLQPLDCAIARRATGFPYIPGLLSFRECPAVLDALARLRSAPDVLLCDGMGIAHPRRLGIASHLGLLTGIPSIGVGKSLLYGRHGPVPERAGDWTALYARDSAQTVIGAVLRSRTGCKPLIISPGHRLSLDTALALTLHCITRYRLPETTRWADGLASRKAAFLRHLPAALQREIPAPV